MEQSSVITEAPFSQKLVDHWKAVLPDGMQVEHEPFDHAYYEGFFPADVYEQMLDKLPAPENYAPLNTKRWARADGESTRDIMPLTAEGIEHLDPERKHFWGQIGEGLGCRALKRLVFDVLKQDLALRLGIPEDQVVDADAMVSALLIRDTEQYRIKPHPDGHPRIVTLMLYLPRDMSQEDLGTSIYVEEPIIKRLFGNRYREVKRFPFRPNSAGTFAVNDLPNRKSLHGRELIEAGAGVRNVIIVTWFSEIPDKEKSKKLHAEPLHDRVG